METCWDYAWINTLSSLLDEGQELYVQIHPTSAVQGLLAERWV